MKGIQRAMRERDVPLDRSLVLFDKLDNSRWAITARSSCCASRPMSRRSSALTDAIAVGVLRAASELGLHVPHDLSVIGFDDILLASHVIPRLTTVAQPVEKIGRKPPNCCCGKFTTRRLAAGNGEAGNSPDHPRIDSAPAYRRLSVMLRRDRLNRDRRDAARKSSHPRSAQPTGYRWRSRA